MFFLYHGMKILYSKNRGSIIHTLFKRKV